MRRVDSWLPTGTRRAKNMPVVPARNAQGQEISVQVQFPGRTVTVKVWHAEAGRVPVILLDTDVAENDRG